MEECTVFITRTTGSLIRCIALLHFLYENTTYGMEKHKCPITTDGIQRYSHRNTKESQALQQGIVWRSNTYVCIHLI